MCDIMAGHLIIYFPTDGFAAKATKSRWQLDDLGNSFVAALNYVAANQNSYHQILPRR